MSKLYTQAEVAKVVGRSHPTVTYAVARKWLKVASTTGRGQLLFREEAIREYARIRNLRVDFGRLEAMTA